MIDIGAMAILFACALIWLVLSALQLAAIVLWHRRRG